MRQRRPVKRVLPGEDPLANVERERDRLRAALAALRDLDVSPETFQSIPHDWWAKQDSRLPLRLFLLHRQMVVFEAGTVGAGGEMGEPGYSFWGGAVEAIQEAMDRDAMLDLSSARGRGPTEDGPWFARDPSRAYRDYLVVLALSQAALAYLDAFFRRRDEVVQEGR